MVRAIIRSTKMERKTQGVFNLEWRLITLVYKFKKIVPTNGDIL